MAAEQVCYRPLRAPVGEPVDRPDEARPVEDVQAAWVDGVAGEQDPAIAVVVGDRRLVVPGSCEAVENTAAEIDLDRRLELAGEAKIWPRGIAFRADYHGVGPIGELAIGRGVVSVRVRMEDEQPVVVRMRV